MQTLEAREEVNWPDVSFGDVQQQVNRILSSGSFARSPQLSRFLQYCVEKTLMGRPDLLREPLLATEVFRRPAGFDARRDPIVRVEARRLRSKLDEYYSAEGVNDPILISFQRGHYVARFAPNWRRTEKAASEPARIAIVEDELLVARDLENRLTSLGYQVVGTAASGEAAVSMVRETRPDLVLMDIILSGRMKGSEAARQIWTDMRIPIVYLTAFSDSVVLDEIRDSEPYGYLLKPFEPRQMHAVLQLALQRRQSELNTKNGSGEPHSSDQVQDLVLNATRDLQQPLRNLRALSQLLAHQTESDSTRAALIGDIEAGVSHVNTLLENLVNQSLGEGALDAALDMALLSLRGEIEDAHAEIRRDPLPHIRGNTQELARAFEGFISSQLKTGSPEEPPIIHIGAEEAPGEWIISVRNEAPGAHGEGEGFRFTVPK